MAKRPHRRLLLLLLPLLWVSFCLLAFRSLLFEGGGASEQPQVAPATADQPQAMHLKRAASSLRPDPGRQLETSSSSAAGQQLGDLLPPDADLLSSSSSTLPSRVLSLTSSSSPSSSSRSDKNEDGEEESDQANQVDSEQRDAKRTSQSRASSRASAPEQDNRVIASESPRQRDSRPDARQQSVELPPSGRRPLAGAQCHYEYPNLFELQFNNIHWQKFASSRVQSNLTGGGLKPATFYLYNAYYDDRWRAGQPSVRVLAMIDRIHPPATNCLLWSSRLRSPATGRATPLVTRAQFVYAWYPKWGNYEDGLLQPWIVTCPVPREHSGLVPDSVSLVDLPDEQEEAADAGAAATAETQSESAGAEDGRPARSRRQLEMAATGAAASIPMPSASSSASSADLQLASVQSPASSRSATTTAHAQTTPAAAGRPASRRYDCARLQARPLTNNLPVFNRRPGPGGREKFAVCVKGLDFPRDDEHVSVRLVEWIELLSLLGAKKIFLYNLDVHENISKVLDHYQRLGLVELSPLTLPGDQPNLPEYQHLYLKQRLTSKRQNELIPYNDCLYRNLYSYQYLALLDIDEIIMPTRRDHSSWHELMAEVEQRSLAEQNYSRASYNVRNVYFFDDLSGPLGTTQSAGGPAEEPAPVERRQRESAERGIPHYLHMMSHVFRSKNYTEPGQYVKCFHNTERVISLHNHFPMNCFGQCTTYSIPTQLAHLQHYRKDCVGPLKQSCKSDFRLFTTRDTTIWRYKRRMIRRTTRVLSRLGLIGRAGPAA